MAVVPRAAGLLFKNNLATVSFDVAGAGDNSYSGFMTIFTDAGAGKDETLLKDLAGDEDVVASSPNGGQITLGTIITNGSTDAYKVLDDARLANSSLTVTAVATETAGTVTWTYSKCRVITVPGPDSDASGSAAMNAAVVISYSSRAVTVA